MAFHRPIEARGRGAPTARTKTVKYGSKTSIFVWFPVQAVSFAVSKPGCAVASGQQVGLMVDGEENRGANVSLCTGGPLKSAPSQLKLRVYSSSYRNPTAPPL